MLDERAPVSELARAIHDLVGIMGNVMTTALMLSRSDQSLFTDAQRELLDIMASSAERLRPAIAVLKAHEIAEVRGAQISENPEA
jgi:hypothetical protein